MRKGKQAKLFVTSFRNELYLPQYVGKAAFVLYISANAQKCPNKYTGLKNGTKKKQQHKKYSLAMFISKD